MSILHSAPQPPIHPVPPELLSEIFLNVDTREADGFVTQSTFACDPGESRSTGSHLGSVCRRWRSITLDTPALWASLRISVIPGWHRDPVRAMERILMHLERSANAPLSIHLTIGNSTSLVPLVLSQSVADAPPELAIWCTLLISIFHQAERIRYLAFILAGGLFPEDPSATSILSYFRLRFTSLVHLSLVTPKTVERVLDLSTFPIQSFTLYQPSRNDNFIQFHTLPFSNITNIILPDATPRGIMRILPHFPNLHAMELHLLSDNSDRPLAGLSQLYFPHLHTLSIEYADELSTDDLCSILKVMVLPVLSNLSLSIRKDGSIPIFLIPAQQSFYPAIKHLLGGVRVLRMARLAFNCGHIPLLFEKMQNVVELKMTLLVVRSNTTSTLLLNELCKEGVMPKLRDLQLAFRRGPEDGLFEKMRDSRRGVLRWAEWKVEDDNQEEYALYGLQFS